MELSRNDRFRKRITPRSARRSMRGMYYLSLTLADRFSRVNPQLVVAEAALLLGGDGSTVANEEAVRQGALRGALVRLGWLIFRHACPDLRTVTAYRLGVSPWEREGPWQSGTTNCQR
jgi:hypothetical protein